MNELKRARGMSNFGIRLKSEVNKTPNQKQHRTPYAVVFFAKNRKKARQHTTPMCLALGVLKAYSYVSLSVKKSATQ